MSTPISSQNRWPVAILGATGAVGQTFIRQLAGHPWFQIAELAASDRSAGRPYADACRWLEGTLPDELATRVVVRCDPAEVKSPLVFSALDSGVAGEVEQAFARAGRLVLSNAKNHRMDSDVPLMIPEVNASHLALLEPQRRNRGWSGGIVTNANCAATVAAMAMAPLHEAFGISRAMVFTMQAVSGAGYPGVASLDILGNVIPFIGEEEPKVERELGKMLGSLSNGAITNAPLTVSAHTNRVPTEHGHLVCLSLGFERRVSPDEAMEAMCTWRGDDAARGLPSAPDLPLVVTREPDRPQTRRDVLAGRGMTVTAGRIRPDPLFDIKLVALGHNTIRGAAGGSILNAELLVARGLLPPA
ncbi:MAG TPA: aspartate-semialdehyde dehydrogenase [Gemmatimonadaceae bacterium]|nr:aspartate-semialdehyde dehydrogenase [Gemmatimonadaceae bacterium]